jgi:hypothetical protein
MTENKSRKCKIGTVEVNTTKLTLHDLVNGFYDVYGITSKDGTHVEKIEIELIPKKCPCCNRG